LGPLHALAAAVKGFLDPEEGEALHRLALEAGRCGPCLEIGSYCGKSALYLGSACRARGAILFSVDHHRGSEEQQPGQPYHDPELFDPCLGCIDTLPFFRRSLAAAGLEETVVPIVSASPVAARAWATPLALLFIDGGHALETVEADYRAWSGHLMPGAYLLFHDLFEDPAVGGQAPYSIYLQALESGRFDRLPRVKTLGVLRRR
jgi:predicted O-methyltransferase YrrM